MKRHGARRGLNRVPSACVEVEPSNAGERDSRKFGEGDIWTRAAIK